VIINRIDRWNLELRDQAGRVAVPVEASADGRILSVFLERTPATPEQRAGIRRELERNYAGTGVRLEFDPEQ
jgi:hypothetical protein